MKLIKRNDITLKDISIIESPIAMSNTNVINQLYELKDDSYELGQDEILIDENFDVNKYQFPIINYPKSNMSNKERIAYKKLILKEKDIKEDYPGTY